MLILGFDLESTGLDTANDRIIELGAVLYETDSKQPVRIFDTFIRQESPMPDGYVSPTGIKGEWLLAHGVPLHVAMGEFQKLISAMPEPIIVGHNIIGYDKPLTLAELNRHSIMGHAFESAHLIDTRQDLPLPSEPSSRKLVHMLPEFARMINPFEHRAVFDAAACLLLMSQFNFEEVLAISKLPLITVRALVTYEMEKERQGAKLLRYTYSGPPKKIWTKQIRENALEREIGLAKAHGFEIVTIN